MSVHKIIYRLTSFLLLGFVCLIGWTGVSLPVHGEENASPSVSSAIVSSVSNSEPSSEATLVPSPGGTRRIFVYGNVMDPDGDQDVAAVYVSLFRTGVTAASCDSPQESDPNHCYPSTCMLTLGDPDTTVRYDCEIDLQYYADATLGSGVYATDNWSVLTTVIDQSSARGDNSGFITNTEVAELNAVSIQPVVSWGNLDLGTITTAQNNVAMAMTQLGNSVSDIEVSGTPLVCESGEIEASRVQYIFSDVDGGTSLTEAPVTLTDFNLPLRTDGDVTKNLFWNISVPETGVGGVCQGVITVTSVISI